MSQSSDDFLARPVLNRESADNSDDGFLPGRRSSDQRPVAKGRGKGKGRPRSPDTSGSVASLLIADAREGNSERFALSVREPSTHYCAGFAEVSWSYDPCSPSTVEQHEKALFHVPARAQSAIWGFVRYYPNAVYLLATFVPADGLVGEDAIVSQIIGCTSDLYLYSGYIFWLERVFVWC